MNKNTLIAITIICVTIITFIFISGSSTGNNTGPAAENTQMKDGVQYITINAGGGYSPRVSTAKAGVPTKLIMKTNGIYDCSASLVINSLGYRKILPQTGETEIDIGTPQAGVPLRGVCGMGMYSFSVNFN
jgi:plastocyanin domain-containing protein